MKKRFVKYVLLDPDLMIDLTAVMPANPDGPWFEFELAERSHVLYSGHAHLALRWWPPPNDPKGCMYAWQVRLLKWSDTPQVDPLTNMTSNWVPLYWPELPHGITYGPGFFPGAKGGGNIVGWDQHYAEINPVAVLWDTRDPVTREEFGLGPGRYRVELWMRSVDAAYPTRQGAAEFKRDKPTPPPPPGAPAPGPYNAFFLEIESIP